MMKIVSGVLFTESPEIASPISVTGSKYTHKKFLNL